MSISSESSVTCTSSRCSRPAGWTTHDWSVVLLNWHLTARELQPVLEEYHDLDDIDQVLQPLVAAHKRRTDRKANERFYM